jgi:arginine decarboxylase
MESYWAYPGSRLMATVRETIDEANAAVFARLVQKISNALLTGSYRHDGAAWDPLQESEARALDVLPPDGQAGDAHKPYFEILVVTPNDPGTGRR